MHKGYHLRRRIRLHKIPLQEVIPHPPPVPQMPVSVAAIVVPSQPLGTLTLNALCPVAHISDLPPPCIARPHDHFPLRALLSCYWAKSCSILTHVECVMFDVDSDSPLDFHLWPGLGGRCNLSELPPNHGSNTSFSTTTSTCANMHMCQHIVSIQSLVFKHRKIGVWPYTNPSIIPIATARQVAIHDKTILSPYTPTVRLRK